ncbi:MAG TPA: GEVED domain-containing protein [Bacteroidota bacterium]|nr:GEVED domain-containing protein [Bacteroidota bacterium]
MRIPSFALLFVLFFFTNTSSQTIIWKLETGNTTTGVGLNAGRSVSGFGGISALSSASTWWGPTQYVYVSATSWQGGSGTKGFKINVKTTVFNNLTLSYAHGSDFYNGTNVGPRDFKIQYSLDDNTYTDIAGSEETITGGTSFDNCVTRTNFALPAACNNSDAVYLRWIMTSNAGVQSSSITGVGASSLANIIISGTEIPVAPTDIALSSSSLNSKQAIGTTVGTLSATDANTSNTFTYSLVAGAGSTDNSLFTITGNQLKVNSVLSPGTYSIRVNVNDGTFNFAKQFSITILNQTPSDIALAAITVTPGAPANTVAGTLSATDADNDASAHTFTLAAGAGDTDNGSFTISGNTLRTNGVLAEGSYSIRVNVNDGVNNFAKQFTVSIGYKMFATSDPGTFYISNITVNTINNTSTFVANGSTNFTVMTTSVSPGQTYTVSVTIDPPEVLTYGVDTYLKIKLYADWNHNYSFDDEGEGFTITESISAQTNSNTITVPASALSGATRFRVICWYDEISTDGSLMPPSFGTFTWGESEDYVFTVGGGLPVELTKFTALCRDHRVRLAWSTATESNNYGYEVERASNGGAFIRIGFVPGSGSSAVAREYSFLDASPGCGTIRYRLKQIDRNGSFAYHEAVSVLAGAPEGFRLLQNSPNPFNPSTTIGFELPDRSPVSLTIYDALGRVVTELVNEIMEPGVHHVAWNGRDSHGALSASGLYLYRLSAGGHVETRQMILMK